MEKKYFVIFDYNNFTNAKIRQQMLVNEYDLNEKIKEEIKTLAIKKELKAEQGKIAKLQTYDLCLFISQSFSVNDRSQSYFN